MGDYKYTKGLSDAVDKIDDGIDDGVREEHNSKTDNSKLQRVFRFLDFFSISECDSIEDCSKNYCSDSQQRPRNNKLIRNTYHFILQSSLYRISPILHERILGLTAPE